jgi:hypothetical protein
MEVCLTENIMSKLQETLTKIMSEPIVEPKTKPVTAPTVKYVEEIIHLQLNQILCQVPPKS